MILYSHYTDFNKQPGNHDGFSKNLLHILRYPEALCHTAEVFTLSLRV